MRWLIGFLTIMMFGVGCFGHRIKAYQYVSVPGLAVVPLKEYKVWIDKDFSEMDRLAIDDAIGQWNYALNGYVRITVASWDFDMEPESIQLAMRERGWIVMKIMSSNPLVGAVDKRPAGEKGYYTLAWCNSIGGNKMYVVRDRIDNTWMNGVMLHEFGHLLGARHDSEYLMQPHHSWENYRCADYEAVRLVAAYRHLDMERLNYCFYIGP